MTKLIKKIPITGILAIICTLLICALIFLISFRINAQSQGESIGTNVGNVVGKAMGSVEGLIDAEKAWGEGLRTATDAKDTDAEIANKMQEVGKLEVLVASVKLNNLHKLADDYSALYLLRGDAVFSIDLANAKIEERQGALYITLQQPSVELIVTESDVEKVAEWQKQYFTGSAEIGFDAYLNTMAKVTEASEDTISNYDSLMNSARESAKKQVTQLANAVAVDKKDVYISFEEKE